MLRRETCQSIGEIAFDGGNANGYRVTCKVCDCVGSEDCIEQIELFEIDGYGEETEGLLDPCDFFGGRVIHERVCCG